MNSHFRSRLSLFLGALLMQCCLFERVASASELVTNGGFESATGPWFFGGSPTAVQRVCGFFPHSGSCYAIFGEVNNNADYATQLISIPSGASQVTLTYWLRIDQGAGTDGFKVWVIDGSATWHLLNSHGNVSQPYTSYSSNLLAYAGQTIVLRFESLTDASSPASFKLDDVSISATVSAGALSVTPSGDFSSSGTQGGPFSPISKDYTLQNTGGVTINWSASKGQSWTSLSQTSGSLNPNVSTTVNVAINSNANTLSPNSYSDSVSFTNTTNNNGNTSRAVTLTVTPICSASLSSPATNASITFPQAFSWTSNCSSQWLAFASSTSPAQNQIWFGNTTSPYTMQSSVWANVVPVIGTSSTYYWTVGEVVGGNFVARASWRSFTITTPTCIATLSNPASGASVTFPQAFSWTSDCSSQWLAFASSTSPAQNQVWFGNTSSPYTMQSSVWANVVPVIGTAPTYYWTVGEVVGGNFVARASWRQFTASSTYTISAPTNLAAVASTSSVFLAWTDNSTNEMGFKIERKTGIGGSWGFLGSTLYNATAYQDSAGLVSGMTYYYRVYAYSGSTVSGYSNEVSASLATVPTAPTITTSTLPNATVGIDYSAPLDAISGQSPYIWSMVSGFNLPTGLSLTTSGTISGTPTSSGNYDFQVRVTGANSQSSSRELNLAVVPVPPPPSSPRIGISTGEVGTLNFTYRAPGRQIQIINIGSGTLNWTVERSDTWFAFTPLTGQTTNGGSPSFLTVSCDQNNTGVFRSGALTITDPNASNSPFQIIVQQTPYAAPAPGSDPFSFAAFLSLYPPSTPTNPPRRNLVVLVHGFNSNPYEWADTMRRVITAPPSTLDSANWDVKTYDWSVDAFPVDGSPVPIRWNEDRARIRGQHLASLIAHDGYEHVHFIAHSLGGRVIQTAATAWRGAGRTMQLTFLAAYTPDDWELEYGQYADYAEHYIYDNIVLQWQPALPDTYDRFENAHNVIINALVPSGSAIENHSQPWRWYKRNIEYFYDSSGCREDDGAGVFGCYGFPLSKEAGNTAWNSGSPRLELPPYPENNVVVLPLANSAASPRAIDNNQTTINPAQCEPNVSSTGSTSVGTNSIGLISGPPSWVTLQLQTANSVNYIEFDYQFSSDADGVMTVAVDGEIVRSQIERFHLGGVQPSGLVNLGSDLNPGTHELGFRLDPLNDQQSSINITNIRTGLLRPGYNLAVSAIGSGTVSPGTGLYEANTTVTLTASPANGFQVHAWTGTNNDSGNTLTKTVTMSGDRSVTVEFEPISSSGGACCVNGSTCSLNVTEADCVNQSGVWQGLDTTSCLNCSGGCIAWSKPEVFGPSPRYGHAMAYDGARSILVGGSYNGSLFGDTWAWDGGTWTQQTGGPSARDFHAMAYDSARGRTVLFGGFDGNDNGETWEWNGSEWIQQFPPVSPSPRQEHAMAYDAAHHLTVLFGGNSSNAAKGDTWLWDGFTWTQGSNGPSPRYQHAMAYDAARQKTVLFGGLNVGSYNDETWEWDGSAWAQQSPSTSPSPRYLHPMAYDSARHVTVLFGGDDASGLNGQTWEWNGSVWTPRPMSGPSARYGHAMAYDLGRSKIALFGGVDGNGYNGETWEFTPCPDTTPPTITIQSPSDGQIFTTTPIAVNGTAADPGNPSSGVSLVEVRVNSGNWQTMSGTTNWNGYVNLVSDSNTIEARSRDGAGLYSSIASVSAIFHPSATDCVAWVLQSNTGPSPRNKHTMAYDASRGESLLFGGQTCCYDYPGDTWAWSGSAWTLRSSSGPPPRYGAAMAYDSTRGVTVLFGGHNSNSGVYFGDTWTWDGNTWTLRSNSGPSPRYIHAMAYDAGRGVTVLFGGTNASTLYNDTWEWNGNAWTDWGNSGPSPRDGHAMAYDGGRGVIVLFGGNTSSDPFYSGETWEWNGSVWTMRASSGPSLRENPAMVYDSDRGVTVLFGGKDDNTRYDDTWEWNGNAWTMRSGNGPSPRSSLAMTFDAGRGVTVLFGGNNAGANYGDTWELTTVNMPLSGDMNRDGVTDGSDLRMFVAAILMASTSPIDLCIADFDASGTVDLGDVGPFVQLLLGS